MRNASDDFRPIHLHHHSFELTGIAGAATSGVMKDVVMVGGYQEAEVDFAAKQPGADAVSLPSAVTHGFQIYGAVRLRRMISAPGKRQRSVHAMSTTYAALAAANLLVGFSF